MYNNPYMKSYNPQNEIEKLDMRINEMEKMKAQLQNQIVSPPSINQTFQLAPNSVGMKTVGTIEDVKKELVMVDTPFFSSDLSTLWVKNVKGDIKTYELHEVVLKDDKDLLIDSLMNQIEELKKERVIKREQPNDKYIDGSTKNEKSQNCRTSSKHDK